MELFKELGKICKPELTKPKFYQAKLVEVQDVIKHVYPTKHQHITLEERMPDNAKCPSCGKNEWWLLPKETMAVQESGKAWCECMNCGYATHL